MGPSNACQTHSVVAVILGLWIGDRILRQTMSANHPVRDLSGEWSGSQKRTSC